jgi:hypothetical protein
MLPIISENAQARQDATRERTYSARENNARTRSTRASRARTNACSMDPTRSCGVRKDESSAEASRGKGAKQGHQRQKTTKPLKRVFPQAPQATCPNQPRRLFLRDIPGEFSRSGVLREIPGIRIFITRGEPDY